MDGDPPPRVSSCFDAQTYLGTSNEYGNGKMNPDIGGPFVAMSNILINLLLPFLVRWSPDVSPSVFLLFSQTIPILLATLSSIGQGSLTLFDAHFTVAVTLSPMSVYVVACCFLHYGGVETSLFRKIPSYKARIIIQWLGLALVPLWFSVSIITSFSTTAFTNSQYCHGMTIPRYIEFLVVSSVTGILDIMGYRDLCDDLPKRKVFGLVFLLLLWVCCIYLVRHQQEIIQRSRKRYQEHIDEGLKRQPLKQFIPLWYVPKVCWDVITGHHPSVFWWFLICVQWSWMLGIMNAFTFGWELHSYGQCFSIFSPVPVLYSFFKVIRRNWKNMRRLTLLLPSFLSQGLCFIVTGKQRWTERQKELKHDYFLWFKRRWQIVLCTWLTYNGVHVVWIWFYVRAGTLPNERNIFNNPHSNWKRYSMMLYINGVFASLFNLFITFASFDCYQKFLHGPRGSDSCRVPFVLSLIMVLLACGIPLFSPFAAMPLSQRWHWDHQCDSYPTEIILQSRLNSSLSSTISFYFATSQGHPRQRNYDLLFSVSSVQECHVLQYHPINDATLSQGLETSIKTLFLNISQQKFFGCSSTFSEASLKGNISLGQPESICSDALGTYTEDPYLFFNITSGSQNTFLRAFDKEFAWDNDAPSFSIHFANEDGSLRDTILLQSALTKRNNPNILKVCSNAQAASAEVLGPLTFFMVYLNQFAAFIDRPRVFPLD